MADDQRVYSDEEFALILRKAGELASQTESPGSPSAGLTLSEMKAAAAQAGLDPALVERAARLLAMRTSASPLERLIGGPLRHDHEARFPTELDEDMAARLLSAVRISAGLAGHRDVGHSGSMGMTWHDGGDPEALSVTARPEEGGTAVSVVLDRRVTLGMVGAGTGVGMFLALIASGALYDVAPALGVTAGIVTMGGALAVARAYWKSSTRKVRERISVAMDAIGQTLAQPVAQAPGVGTIRDGTSAPGPDTSEVGDAELSGT
jgi:hypothetical protein